MRSPDICVFSKHLQFIQDYGHLAEVCRTVGLDGVDITVRSGGHVLPGKAGRDLPKVVRALESEGLRASMITTRLRDGREPEADEILSAASDLGIRYFRVGGHKYSGSGHPLTELETFAGDLRTLAGVAERHGMVAGYHNHSGRGNVGAALWDLHWLFQEVGSPALGANFDIGHAKVEGAFGAWEVNARLLAPFVKMMAVKDFIWHDGRPAWCRLGEGHAPLAACFGIMRQAGFSGPVSIHMEYDAGSRDDVIADIARAVKLVRAALTEAGY